MKNKYEVRNLTCDALLRSAEQSFQMIVQQDLSMVQTHTYYMKIELYFLADLTNKIFAKLRVKLLGTLKLLL